MAHKTPSELRELAAHIGKFIEYWGFKKVHGQIWTYIFLSKEPVNATSLVRRLNVSKALVSLAIKDLLKFQVIRVSSLGQRRKIFLESNPDIMQVISNVLAQRERKLLAEIKESFAKIQRVDEQDSLVDIDREKLEDLGEMIDMAAGTLDIMIQHNLDIIATPSDDTEV